MSRREWLEHLSAATAHALAELREHDAVTLRRLRADLEDLDLRVRGELAQERRDHPRLLVFLCGTTLMHAAAVGHTRAERVAQATTGTDPSLGDYATYVATEDALERLRDWSNQGAEISYLSYHRNSTKVAVSAAVARAQGFPAGRVLARTAGETYHDVVRRAAPDILIEDDCTSTTTQDIAYRQLDPKLREQITSIIVPQFGGLGHLPTNLTTLADYTA